MTARIDTKPRSAWERWVRDAADVAPLEYSLRKLKTEHAELVERLEAEAPERERQASTLAELRDSLDRLSEELRTGQREVNEALARLQEAGSRAGQESAEALRLQQQAAATLAALEQRVARGEELDALAAQRWEYHEGQIDQLRGLSPRLEWLEQQADPQRTAAKLASFEQRIARGEELDALAAERWTYQEGQIDQLRKLSPRLEWLEQHGEPISQLRGYLQRLERFDASLAELAAAQEQQRRELAALREFREPQQQAQLQLPHERAGGPVGGRRRASRTPQRLAFLVHTLELLNHFGAVWDLLPSGSFDVVLHGEAAEGPRDALEPWGCTVTTSADVLARGVKYDFLVSNHPVVVDLLGRLAERQVRFMYAAGKSGWNLSEWNKLYDVILCFGPFHAAKFEAISSAVVVQMGYPRFDRYFQETPDRPALLARYGCDPAKRTVVWLPTWKSLSSVGHYDAEISALMADWNVVVKLHPLMTRQEPERVEALRRHAFSCLITDASDNLPLYQLADAMLFDYGGPPLAGVYADKDMLLLNVPNAEGDEVTGADSPDVAIRSELPSVSPHENRIAGLLADDATWEAQRHARRALRSRYFAPFYGFSADVAAGALLRLRELVAQGR